MRKGFFALFLALAILPAAALAQQSTMPANPPAGPSAGMRSAVRSMIEQTAKLHEQFRTQVLSALTAEHRDMIAKAIGQLAIAPSPDPQAVAQQIDSALTPGEKQQILSAQTALMKQTKALRQQMMQQLRSQFHPPSGSMRAHATQFMQRRAQQPPTAGMVVLHALTFGHGGHMLMMHGQGPPPQP